MDVDLTNLPEGARIEQVNGGAGVIVRAANGKFLPGTRSHAPITHENARTLAHARHDAARERFAAGMTRSAVERGRIPVAGARPLDAWEDVGYHTTGVLFDADTPRAMSDLGRFIGQSAGMLAAERTAQHDGDNVSVTVSAPADMVMAILAELARRKSE